MAAKTIEEIKALDFGYLSGDDLLKFCAYQLLQKQDIIDSTLLEYSVQTAISEIISTLGSRYNVESEFQKKGNSRNFFVVKLTTLQAIKNIVSNLAGIPDILIDHFKELELNKIAIRQGQLSLYGLENANENRYSPSYMTESKFITLG